MKDFVTAYVKVTGDVSSEEFEGAFEAKVKLSTRELLREDEIYRNVLGQNPNSAGALAAALASQIAYLSVRVSKAPAWFTSAGNGLEFKDSNVLEAVVEKVKSLVDAEWDAHRKAAEEAQKPLKVEAEKLSKGEGK